MEFVYCGQNERLLLQICKRLRVVSAMRQIHSNRDGVLGKGGYRHVKPVRHFVLL